VLLELFVLVPFGSMPLLSSKTRAALLHRFDLSVEKLTVFFHRAKVDLPRLTP
jgi:hypothetical protein